MIVVKNDYSNVEGMAEQGVNTITLPILQNELTALIHNNESELAGLLVQTANAQMNEAPSKQEMVYVLASELGSNVKMNKAIAYLVAVNNKVIEGSVDQDEAKKKIDLIANQINTLTTELEQDQGNHQSFYEQILATVPQEEASAPVKASAPQSDTGSNKGKIALYVLGGLAVVGLGYLIYKSRKTAKIEV